MGSLQAIHIFFKNESVTGMCRECVDVHWLIPVPVVAEALAGYRY